MRASIITSMAFYAYEVLYVVYGISVSVTHLILWLAHAKGKAGIIPCSAGGKLGFSC